MKIVCPRHEYAYESTRSCPWCEPSVVSDPSLEDFAEPSPSSSGPFSFYDAGFLYEGVARMVEDLGCEVGLGGYSSIGMVVGATQPESAAKLRKEHPTSVFLVPGVGAQSGSLDTAAACFNYHGHGNVPYGGAIVNNSRALLYPEKYGTGDSVADATKRFAEQLHHHLSTRRS